MMRPLSLVLLVACTRAQSATDVDIARTVAARELDVTEGSVTSVDGHLRIDAPAVRAVLKERTAPDAEIRFRYLGPTESPGVLRSGAVRTQIGLKLRAADSCNVLYAMLRITPEPSIVVQSKINPGKHGHRECGSEGYRTVVPARAVGIECVAIGAEHRLRAVSADGRLEVWLDDVVVWEGAVSEDVLAIDGPVGFRTDGGRFDVAFFAPRYNPG